MEIHRLKTFVTAAELTSFTRAAEQLQITQAAVSQSVHALEKELDTALFHRTGRGIELTDAGRRLYPFALQILELAQTAREAVTQKKATLAGTLSIASSSVPAEWLVPRLLRQFHLRFPDVRCNLAVSDSRRAAQLVEQREADLGFVGEMPRDGSLVASVVAADQLVLVVAKGHPLATRTRIRPAELPRHAIVVREEGSGTRRCLQRAVAEVAITWDMLPIALETDSSEAVRSAVTAGLGVAFLSKCAVRPQLQAGELVAVDVEGLQAERDLFLIRDPKRLPSPAGRAFEQLVASWHVAAKQQGDPCGE